jgi:hypothetical protein
MSAMSWSSGTMIDAGALISAIAEGDELNSEWLVESILREGRAREAICALATVGVLLCHGGDECTSAASGTTLGSLLAAIHLAASAHPETVPQSEKEPQCP